VSGAEQFDLLYFRQRGSIAHEGEEDPREYHFPGILQFLVYTGTARAQDPFEIDVYEYEQLAPGGLTLEGHFNFVGIGTDSFEGPVAPTNHRRR